MQTLHGIRFLPIAHVRGTLLGLDARWLGRRGFLVVLLMTLVSLGGPENLTGGHSAGVQWAHVLVALSTFGAIVLTSLGHELGHAFAGRVAGLQVRAVVLGPEGGMTIRSASDRPHVNLRTALAGPLANAVFGCLFAALALWAGPERLAAGCLSQIAAVQLLTGIVNLLPFGALDGSKIVESWRACQALA